MGSSTTEDDDATGLEEDGGKAKSDEDVGKLGRVDAFGICSDRSGGFMQMEVSEKEKKGGHAILTLDGIVKRSKHEIGAAGQPCQTP